MRFAAPYDSHDLADATSRAGFSAPRLRASSPTMPEGAGRSQGSASAAGREIQLAGKIQERRQQRARGDLVRVDELRNLAHLDRPAAPRLRLRSPTASAQLVVPRSIPTMKRGATGVGLSGFRRLRLRRARRSAARPGAPSAGSCTRETASPRCRRTPRNGPSPTTRPTSLIEAGSNPLGTVTGCSSAPSRIGSSSKAPASARRQFACTSRTAAPIWASA